MKFMNKFDIWEMFVNSVKWSKEYIPTKDWIMNWTKDNSLRALYLYNQKMNKRRSFRKVLIRKKNEYDENEKNVF